MEQTNKNFSKTFNWFRLGDIFKWLIFYRHPSANRGVYNNFKEAAKRIHNVGYNNAKMAQRYLKAFNKLDLKIVVFEYEMFNWLNSILSKKETLRIFDFGGNLGVHFYRFSKKAVHPRFEWIVCEVERIVNVASSSIQDRRLSFVSNFYASADCDVFFSCGTIQYVEDFYFPRLPKKPEHVILARLPVQDKVKTFVTFQNIGSSYSPQYVFNHDDFVKSFLILGYELIDEWKNGYDSCIIPFHRDISCEQYSGFYFKLKH